MFLDQEEIDAEDMAAEKVLQVSDGSIFGRVLASALDKVSCPDIHIRCMLDVFWHLQMSDILAKLDRIYEELSRRKKPVEISSDTGYVIPHRTKKILAHELQSINLLYVWEKKARLGRRVLHIRRFYKKWEPDDSDDVERFKAEVAANGYDPAINQIWCLKKYADDSPGRPYPERLSLDSYKAAKYEMKYGDCRDIGYVASWDENTQKVENAVNSHSELTTICECYLKEILFALFGEGEDAD